MHPSQCLCVLGSDSACFINDGTRNLRWMERDGPALIWARRRTLLARRPSLFLLHALSSASGVITDQYPRALQSCNQSRVASVISRAEVAQADAEEFRANVDGLRPAGVRKLRTHRHNTLIWMLSDPLVKLGTESMKNTAQGCQKPPR